MSVEEKIDEGLRRGKVTFLESLEFYNVPTHTAVKLWDLAFGAGEFCGYRKAYRNVNESFDEAFAKIQEEKNGKAQ